MRAASPACFDLIRLSEGLKDGDRSTPNFDPYLDPVGIWTIAYGHAIVYGSRMLRGKEDEALARALYPNGLTLDECETLLASDVLDACRNVEHMVKRPLSQGQFDALVDFCFNPGPGRLAKSTLLRKVLAYDDAGAALEFERWVYAGRPPQKFEGLVRRRQRERALWECRS